MYAPSNSVYSMYSTPDLSALHMTSPTASPLTQTPPTTPRRSRAMPIDGPTVKFLYTIIKQLDLKSIDWALVATDLGISNGHAARMRYSRFRQQMEGILPTPRPSRAKKVPKRATKASPAKAGVKRESASPQPDSPLPRSPTKQEPGYPPYGSTSHIKTEAHTQTTPSLGNIPLAAPSVTESTSHISMMPTVGNITIAAPPARDGMPYYPASFSPGEPALYSPLNMVTGVLGEPYDPRLLHHTLNWEPYKSEPVTEVSTINKVVKEEHQQEVKAESQEEVREAVEGAIEEAVPEGAQQKLEAVIIDD